MCFSGYVPILSLYFPAFLLSPSDHFTTFIGLTSTPGSMSLCICLYHSKGNFLDQFVLLVPRYRISFGVDLYISESIYPSVCLFIFESKIEVHLLSVGTKPLPNSLLILGTQLKLTVNCSHLGIAPLFTFARFHK